MVDVGGPDGEGVVFAVLVVVLVTVSDTPQRRDLGTKNEARRRTVR